jgi:hypothetical protein
LFWVSITGHIFLWICAVCHHRQHRQHWHLCHLCHHRHHWSPPTTVSTPPATPALCPRPQRLQQPCSTIGTISTISSATIADSTASFGTATTAHARAPPPAPLPIPLRLCPSSTPEFGTLSRLGPNGFDASTHQSFPPSNGLDTPVVSIPHASGYSSCRTRGWPLGDPWHHLYRQRCDLHHYHCL